jgi:trk system potassium uptake protein TrkA
MEESLSFIPLLIVVLLAFLVPLALSRFRRLSVPVVVGEILAGIIIGDSGLKLVGHDPVLEILALLGFAYLMFLSGLEVDFGAILPRPGAWRGSWTERLNNPLALGLLTFLLTLVLAVLAGLGLHALDVADDPWLAALILSTTSLGLVMPVLKERGMMARPYGQALLVAAVVADFATMLLVSVYVVLHTEGLSLDVLLVLLLFGAFLTVYRLAILARRRLPGLELVQSVAAATAQLDVRGAFAIGLAFIALAEGLGVEMILGAFLGGALISLLADRGASDLHHRLDVIGYAFFIPIFFIMVGVRFDLSALLDSSRAMLLVPLVLGLAYGIKFLAGLVFRISYSWRETLAAGALLSSRLSLIIAVSAIGLQLGSIDAATNAAIILVAIVTSTVSPLLFNRLAPVVESVRRKFVLAGAGRSARLLAARILGHGEDVVLVDQHPQRLARAREMELPLVEADPADPKTWRAMDPATIRAVAVLLPEDEVNLQISRLVRDELGIKHLISRVHDATQSTQFTDLGVQVINPSLSPVVELEYLLLFPSVSSLMTDLEDEHDFAEVSLGCPDFVGRPLGELDLPEGVMIVLVRRGSDVVYPRSHTVLQIGDRLTLMGSLEAVRELVEKCK